MQSVIQTPAFLAQAKRCGLSDDEIQEIVSVIAADPEAGAIMAHTGGTRKLRHACDGCAFRRIRSAVPTTSGQSFRGIRSAEDRCR